MLGQVKDYLKPQNLHFQNVIVPLLTKVSTSILYIIIIPYAIAHIGESAYGVLAFFLMLHASVSLFDAGFSYAFGLRYARNLATDKNRATQIAYDSFPIYFALSLAAFIGFIVFSSQLCFLFFSNYNYVFYVALLGPVLCISVIDSFFVVIIQGHNQVRLINLNRFFLDIVKIASIFILVTGKMRPEFILYGIFLSAIVKLILDIYVVRRLTGHIFFSIRWNSREWNENFSLAGASIVIAGMSLVMSLADKTLVNRSLSSEQFASYSFAFDLTQKAYFLMYAVVGATYPTLIRRHTINKSSADLVKINFLALAAITVAYYLPLAIVPEKILGFFVSADFGAKTAAVLPYSAAAAVLYLSFNVFENYFNAQGRVKTVLVVYVAGIISLLVGLKVFIPLLAEKGAALSVGVMFGIMNAVMIFLLIVNWKKQQLTAEQAG